MAVPYAFDYLAQYADQIKLGITMPNLHRTIQTQLAYEKHKLHHPHLASFVKQKYLTGTNVYKLSRNEFPYHVAPNVHHYILWSKIRLDCHEIYQYLDKVFSPLRWAFYENPLHMKSIPQVEHYQVFVEWDIATSSKVHISHL